ncbi:hypothetical protein [Micromonospora sp. HK10]|uniref:hypothetical protein n=1 Tax=Micromonospora sp. HK10 TaxID=1538294 RepID=UPI0006273ED3|nr:hypothetical protein [Micromonospora sp. HK10]
MPHLPAVRRAQWRDVTDIVPLVADPFAASALGAWLVPDERRRRSVLTAVIRVWIEHALLSGEAYLLHDRSAVAVWLHRYGVVPAPEGYGRRLAVACAGHLDRFLSLDDVLHAHRPAGPHHHLAFFAVAPSPNRIRRAGTLLAASNARMGQALLPTYAEATTAPERDLYARHGYLARDPFALPGGGTAYPMWRNPGRRQPGRALTRPAICPYAATSA